jgi:hypothetical protein
LDAPFVTIKLVHALRLGEQTLKKIETTTITAPSFTEKRFLSLCFIADYFHLNLRDKNSKQGLKKHSCFHRLFLRRIPNILSLRQERVKQRKFLSTKVFLEKS